MNVAYLHYEEVRKSHSEWCVNITQFQITLFKRNAIKNKLDQTNVCVFNENNKDGEEDGEPSGSRGGGSGPLGEPEDP